VTGGGGGEHRCDSGVNWRREKKGKKGEKPPVDKLHPQIRIIF